MPDLLDIAQLAVKAAIEAGAEWADASVGRGRTVGADVENSSLSVQDLRKVIHDEGVPDAALARMGNGGGRWHPFTNAQTALMRAAYAQDLAWLRGGADGLATYIDSPEAIAGATGPRRGQHDDERQTRMG